MRRRLRETSDTGTTPPPAGRRPLSPRGRRVGWALGALGLCLLIAWYVLGPARTPRLHREGGGTLTAEQRALLGEATAKADRGDLRAAVVAFRRAIEFAPDHAPAYVALGETYQALDWPAEAARSFRRAIALDRDNAAAHLGLGRTLARYGRTADAVPEVELALELAPDDGEAAYVLALLLMETGDIERELEALERTVSLDPENTDAQFRLGNIHLTAGRHGEAVAAYEAALEGRGEIEYVRTQLARAYYLDGDHARAEEILREDAAARPRAPSPHANLARLLIDQGRTTEALPELETALSLATDPSLRARLEAELASLRGDRPVSEGDDR